MSDRFSSLDYENAFKHANTPVAKQVGDQILKQIRSSKSDKQTVLDVFVPEIALNYKERLLSESLLKSALLKASEVDSIVPSTVDNLRLRLEIETGDLLRFLPEEENRKVFMDSIRYFMGNDSAYAASTGLPSGTRIQVFVPADIRLSANSQSIELEARTGIVKLATGNRVHNDFAIQGNTCKAFFITDHTADRPLSEACGEAGARGKHPYTRSCLSMACIMSVLNAFTKVNP